MKQYVQLGLRVRVDSAKWSLERIWGPGGIDGPCEDAVGKARPASGSSEWDRCSRTILVPCGECDAPYRIKLLKAVDEAVWERIKELQDVRQGVQRAVEVLTAGSVNEPPEDAVTPSTWMVQGLVQGSDEAVYGKADKLDTCTTRASTIGSNEPSRPSAMTTLYLLSTVGTAQCGGAPGVQITKRPMSGTLLFGEATAVGCCGLLADMSEGQYYSLHLAQMAWDDQPLTEQALDKLRSVASAVASDNMPDSDARRALLAAIERLTLDDAANGTVVQLQEWSLTQSNCDDDEDDDDDDDEDTDEEDDEFVECTRYAFVAWEEDNASGPHLVVELQDQGYELAVSNEVGETVQEDDVDLHTDSDNEATLASVCIPEDDELEGDVLERLIESATEALRDVGCEDEFGHNPIDLVVDAANAFFAARDRARQPRVVEVSLQSKRTAEVSLPPKRTVDVSLSPAPQPKPNWITW